MNTTHTEERALYVGQLQTIHALRDTLELSDREYRALLVRLTGATSAKFMTPEGREKVIAFMSLYREIDETVAQAETARSVLNNSFTMPDVSASLPKDIFLNGDFLNRNYATIETILRTMRGLYGDRVFLTGAAEKRRGQETRLRLDFTL